MLTYLPFRWRPGSARLLLRMRQTAPAKQKPGMHRAPWVRQLSIYETNFASRVMLVLFLKSLEIGQPAFALAAA